MSFWSKVASGLGGLLSTVGSTIPVVGTYISGVGNALGAYGDAKTQEDIMRMYNAGQMELAKYNNEYNKQLWYEQQAYNSPAEQMKRFSAAGLNPNLIYSQSNEAGSFTPAATPNLQPEHGMDKLGQKMSQANFIKNLQLMDSQISKNQADAGKAAEEAGLAAARKEHETIWNNLQGTDEFTQNFQSINFDTANRVNLDYQRALSEYKGLLGDSDSMSYWQLQRSEQSFQSGIARLRHDLLDKYGAKHELAVIYNLINGNKAQQMSARSSMVMANVAGDRLGLDQQKYNDVRQLIIDKYGYENLEKKWSGLYLMKKYFGNTFDQILKQKQLDQSKLFKMIDTGIDLLKLWQGQEKMALDFIF